MNAAPPYALASKLRPFPPPKIVYAGSTQDLLKSAERYDPKGAFELCMWLAQERSVPEAWYRCAKMAYQGYGTERNLGQAVGFGKLASVAGHAGAATLLGEIEKEIEKEPDLDLLEKIISNLTGADAAPPTMPGELQRIFVDLIMASEERTKRGAIESLTITRNDFETACDRLLKIVGNPDSFVYLAIEKYKKHDNFALLLSEGVAAYKKDNNTAIGVMTQAPDFIPPDIWVKHILSRCSPIALAKTDNLAKTNKFPDSEPLWAAKLKDGATDEVHNPQKLSAKKLFLTRPDLRKDRYIAVDKIGEEYLNKQGIHYPILIQITDGLCSVADVKALQKKMDETSHGASRRQQDALASSLVCAYILAGSVTLDEVINNPNHYAILFYIQRQIAKIANWRDCVDQIVGLPFKAAWLLVDEPFKNWLDDDLTILEQLNGVTDADAVMRTLSDPDVLEWLNKNRQFIGPVIALPADALEKLKDPIVRIAIENKTNAVDDLRNPGFEVDQYKALGI